MASGSRTQEEPPLPQEVVQEILLRVPIKTLIKCICICRAWQYLIKSPSFITSHSKHQLKDDDSKLLFVIGKQKGSYSLLSDAFTKLENTKIPFQVDSPDCFITSRNGLLCVDVEVDTGRHIFLWNPSVRRFKSIDTILFGSSTTSCQSIVYYQHEDDIYALGLDEFRNEYKVVKIYGNGTKADVYCLSTNSWHTTLLGNKDIFPIIQNRQKHAHVNGAIHWLSYFGANATYQNDLAILSFDFWEEVLQDFSLPTNDQSGWSGEVDLKVLKGMLSFIVSYQMIFVERSLCHVWLMKEYGVVESWTKAYTIVPGTRCYCALGFTYTRKFVYHLSEGNRLMSYDLDNEKYAIVHFEDSFVTQVFFDFKESLILLDQGSASIEKALQDYQRTGLGSCDLLELD